MPDGIPDEHAECPLDRVNRQFNATRPNQLWVADFTFVATWSGFVYVAFVIDVFARASSAGAWRAQCTLNSSSMPSNKPCGRPRPLRDPSTTATAAANTCQVRCTERLAEAGVETSVDSVGDSYDNALAESIIGLHKTEVIHRRGPWRHIDAVEYATLEWIDSFNHRRLFEPIRQRAAGGARVAYHRQQQALAMAT